jgi:predicted transcriptional regulator
VSHKVQIVSLYLKWKTYSEIERATGHTVGSIKSYLNDFCRVMMARERGIASAKEIGFYLGRTERLVGEYLALLKEAEALPEERERLKSLKYQMAHLERKRPGKRGLSTMVWRALPS